MNYKLEINTGKLEEIFKEWRGNKSCYDAGRPVFDSAELLDFTQYCLVHEANKIAGYKDKPLASCEGIQRREDFLHHFKNGVELYRTNCMFSAITTLVANGASPYDLMLELIFMVDQQCPIDTNYLSPRADLQSVCCVANK